MVLARIAVWEFISTHALTELSRGGSFQIISCVGIYFNSRPHGGRRSSATSSLHSMTISTHALTEGDDFFCSLSG